MSSVTVVSGPSVVSGPDAATRRDGAAGGAAPLRRVAVLLVSLLLVVAVSILVSQRGAEAELADKVAGHAVVEPGQTLWDVAVVSAPDGVDPRAQLAAIKDLNGIDGSHVAAWSVVLLPAR